MPARALHHEHVRRALEHDGWTITHDPLRLKVRRRRPYVDLGAVEVGVKQRHAVAGAFAFLERRRAGHPA